jgi:hypothetical protein
LQRTEWALAGIGREEMIEKARVAFASRRGRWESRPLAGKGGTRH